MTISASISLFIFSCFSLVRVTVMDHPRKYTPEKQELVELFNEHIVSNIVPVVQPPSVEEVLHDAEHKIPMTISKNE